MMTLLSRPKMLSRACVTAVALVAAVALGACSLKKNTAASRRYTEFITRYNIYFNGDQHFKETLAQMEKDYPDDYTRLIPVHPVDAYADESAPQPSGSFERSMEKAQKAIELRSIKKKPRRKPGRRNDPDYAAWLKRGEYNPFLHNAWLMLGRSQFFNGDFSGASATFAYIIKHFGWLPAAVAEARLYQAWCYTALGWPYEAEGMLARVKEDDLSTPALRALYPLVKADCLIEAGRLDEAVAPLRRARDMAKGVQKTRLTFLLGQILERGGDRSGAYDEYSRVARSNSATYHTRFNARIKQSEVYAGDNIGPEVKSLRALLRYDSNKDYRDQIYYAIGNLYLSRRDTARAIENYILADKESTRSGIDRALARLRLGELYFDRRRYDLAQPPYAEAVPQLPKDYPGLDNIRRRSDVLDELAVYAGNVALQDSLLRLSAMTPEQQLEVVNRIIAELKEREAREAEEARRSDYEASRQDGMADNGTRPGGAAGAPASFALNNDKSWYFYNTALKNAGKTEFQKRWGSRKLEDDWRRRNKASFSFSDFDSPDSSADEADGAEERADGEGAPGDTPPAAMTDSAADPHYPQYYLRQIPSDDLGRATAHQIIQEGRYNMGLILKDKLEDFQAAAGEWDILLRDYPDNVYRLDTYFNLYLMYMRMGDTALAERYRSLILSDFAESEQGLALRDPRYIDNLREMNARQLLLYEEAYDAFVNDDPAAVRSAAAEMAERFPMSPVMPKMMFIDALTYVPEGAADTFAIRLRTLLERFPEAEVSPVASAYLRDLSRGRRLQSGPMGGKAMVWETRLTNDTTLAYDPDAEIAFDIADEGEPLYILTYSTDSVTPNRLLYDIARHNFSTFKVKDYDLEQMNFGRLGLLVISGFGSMAELDHYRATLAGRRDGAALLPPQVKPVVISRKNFDLLLSGGHTFEEYFRAVEAARVEALEERLGVPPEEGADGQEKPGDTDATEAAISSGDGDESRDGGSE